MDGAEGLRALPGKVAASGPTERPEPKRFRMVALLPIAAEVGESQAYVRGGRTANK